VLIKRAAKLAKASGEPNKNKVGQVTRAQLAEIAEDQREGRSERRQRGRRVRMLAGTARSMGITRSKQSLANVGERPNGGRASNGPFEPQENTMAKTEQTYQRRFVKVDDAQTVHTLTEAAARRQRNARRPNSTRPSNSPSSSASTRAMPTKWSAVPFRCPHGTGKTCAWSCSANQEQQQEAAKEAGAIEAGGEDLVKKVSDGWTDFDAAVAVAGHDGRGR
jgi:hypothetical protein